tara:strand:+ start:311 stop:730 length:420 start_codon:yes stop_codon:yes gene_type:complete
MQTQKRVFSKLFKETAKNKFNNHSTKLGIAQDLEGAVYSTNNSLETGDKVVAIAINVNNELEKLTEDVRFYNDYKAITYDQLGRDIEYLKELMQKAENVSQQLGTDVNDIKGYDMAKNTIIDAQRVSGNINTHTLNFDI